MTADTENDEVLFAPNFSSQSWFSFSFTVYSCWQLMTTNLKKNIWNFHLHSKVSMCAKLWLSGLIFIFINCYRLLTAVDSWQHLIWKISWPTVNTCAKFWLSRLIFIFINCYQLSLAVDSWYEKKIAWNFYVHTIGDTCVNFHLSRLIFIFINCYQLSLAVNSCWQLITVYMKKKLTGIFMYTLKLILVPNLSSLGLFSFLPAVNSCYQLLTADDTVTKKFKRNFPLLPKCDVCAKFELCRLLGGPARECDRWTDVRTDRHMPGENRAKSPPPLLGWCQGLSWAKIFFAKNQLRLIQLISNLEKSKI